MLEVDNAAKAQINLQLIALTLRKIVPALREATLPHKKRL
jgi:hypothetical protein